MNSSGRRIEIFAPFGEAVELTQTILFRPFSLTKWFVIGFAAWLATFFSGGYHSFRHPFGTDWRHVPYYPVESWSVHSWPFWVFPVAAIGGLCLLALVILLLWVNARGRFIFVDCIVRNRAAIVEPWHENATEADRFFVFALVVALASLVCFGCVALLWFLSTRGAGVIVLPLAVIITVGVVVIFIIIGIIMNFMVPVMYRQRCGAADAFWQVWRLMVENPLSFILFILFLIVLYIAAMMIGCILSCLTCCIAALPYIGTVILLPIVMALYAFTLCFLRQFGDPYDVWAVVRPIEPPPPPPAPPVQLPPSP